MLRNQNLLFLPRSGAQAAIEKVLATSELSLLQKLESPYPYLCLQHFEFELPLNCQQLTPHLKCFIGCFEIFYRISSRSYCHGISAFIAFHWLPVIRALQECCKGLLFPP